MNNKLLPLARKGTTAAIVMLIFGVLLLSTVQAAANVTSIAFSVGSWVQKADMPTPRDLMAAVAFNDRIVVIGGSSASGPLDTVEIYWPSTDTWTIGRPMPAPKAIAGGVRIGDLIYVVGTDQRLFAYDPQTDSWTEKASVPVPLNAEFGIATVGCKLYVGIGQPYESPVIYVYDPISNAWESKTPAPVTRSISSFAVLNGIIYVFGGGEPRPDPGPTEIKRVDAYDPIADSWTINALPSLAIRRGHLSRVSPVLGQYIFIIGGWNGFTALSAVEVFDGSAWVFDAPMYPARYNMATTALNGRIYVFGGNWGGWGGHWMSITQEYIPAEPLMEPPSEDCPLFREISIDIKPGSFPNSINPKSRGKIPVAILSSPDFNAPDEVDRTSLTFGATGNEASLAFCKSSSKDINDDGLPDLLCHFYTQKAGFQPGDTEGILKGKTVAGIPFIGSDSVRIVPCRKCSTK
ncbi:MAG: hypothetical protein GXP39_14735 [Chloroflexi bacterium]|nr:hypothetical protein [Chloroflexota bacterium]